MEPTMKPQRPMERDDIQMAHPNDIQLQTPSIEGATIPAPETVELPPAAETKFEAAKAKVGEMSDKVSEKAGKLAHDASLKSDEALTTVGEKIVDLASTLRGKAPAEGKLHDAAEKVASSLETSGDYLVSHGVGDIASDMTGIIRKYPIQSLWVGIGVGVLLGTALARR